MYDLSLFNNFEKLYYLTHDNLFSDKNVRIKDFKMKEVPKFKENIEGIENYLDANINKTIVITLKPYQIKPFTKRIVDNYLITDINKIFLNRINIIPNTNINNFS